jgi:ABC-type uncharacterized transport system ATPase subunit
MLIPPQPEARGAARVEMLGFAKRFGALQALDDVSLTVAAGSFHALLGENGAGKSTLVKSLIGFYRADRGSVMVDGREREINSPRDAAALGIGMIFQHFTVVPGMTVAENLALAGRDLAPVIDWKAERARLTTFMTTAPFPLDLDARVAGLAAGEKQKLEILKALYTRRRFLVLDEPTSVLTPLEADEVLGQMKALCRAGQLTVLIITHKFREVFGFCDAVTVLRRGRLTGAAKVEQTSRDQLAGWMMGVEPSETIAATAAPAAAAVPGTPRLAISGLRVAGNEGRLAIDGLNLAVQPGEIVGVAGVSGNGQRELVAALTGAVPISSLTVAQANLACSGSTCTAAPPGDDPPPGPTATALATPARNSATRPGRQAMPRSPASQSPAGRLCSTSCRRLALRRLLMSAVAQA